MDGWLFKEDAEYELVPEEERPGYDEEIGGFENEFDKAWGCLRKIHHGWSDVDYQARSSSTPPSTVITSASRRSSRTERSWRSCGTLVRCMDSPSHRVLSGFHHCLSKRRMDVDGLSYVIEGRSSLDCKP